MLTTVTNIVVVIVVIVVCFLTTDWTGIDLMGRR